jgi:gliding motility-associated-like protein
VLGTQTLSTSGIYSEVFTTTGGCDSIVNLELNVLDCEALLEISNICTPNDDGKNDTWRVSDLTQIQGCTVQIFNRWGQLLYETDNYQNDWEGKKDNGEELPDATYYYVIKCDDDRLYQGAINLMRYKQ